MVTDRVAQARQEIARLRMHWLPWLSAIRAENVAGLFAGVLDDADASLDQHAQSANPDRCTGCYSDTYPCPDALAVLNRYAPEVS